MEEIFQPSQLKELIQRYLDDEIDLRDLYDRILYVYYPSDLFVDAEALEDDNWFDRCLYKIEQTPYDYTKDEWHGNRAKYYKSYISPSLIKMIDSLTFSDKCQKTKEQRVEQILRIVGDEGYVGDFDFMIHLLRFQCTKIEGQDELEPLADHSIDLNNMMSRFYLYLEDNPDPDKEDTERYVAPKKFKQSIFGNEQYTAELLFSKIKPASLSISNYVDDNDEIFPDLKIQSAVKDLIPDTATVDKDKLLRDLYISLGVYYEPTSTKKDLDEITKQYTDRIEKIKRLWSYSYSKHLKLKTAGRREVNGQILGRYYTFDSSTDFFYGTALPDVFKDKTSVQREQVLTCSYMEPDCHFMRSLESGQTAPMSIDELIKAGDDENISEAYKLIIAFMYKSIHGCKTGFGLSHRHKLKNYLEAHGCQEYVSKNWEDFEQATRKMKDLRDFESCDTFLTEKRYKNTNEQRESEPEVELLDDI
jgi:hypothetical protein